MSETKTKRTPKATSRVGYGIVNPYGDMWTTDIFETEDSARKHLANFWRGVENQDLRRYRIVRAETRTSFLGDLATTKGEDDGNAG